MLRPGMSRRLLGLQPQVLDRLLTHHELPDLAGDS
jgi:hypothetical protein